RASVARGFGSDRTAALSYRWKVVRSDGLATMNRRERRGAAALNRSQRVGYLHRVMAAIANGVTPLRLGLHITSIKHDQGCPHRRRPASARTRPPRTAFARLEATAWCESGIRPRIRRRRWADASQATTKPTAASLARRERIAKAWCSAIQRNICR